MDISEESESLRLKRKRKIPLKFICNDDESPVKKSSSTKSNLHPPPFSCHHCQATQFLKTTNKTQPSKRRWIFDANLNKKVMLCNACGLKMKRQKLNPAKTTLPNVSEDKKELYLKDGREFGQRLCIVTKEDEAKNFFCPKFRSKGCGCLQTFIMSSSNNVKEFIKDSVNSGDDIFDAAEGDSNEIVKRAKLLLRYHKRAKELITALNAELQGRPGSKRSKEFEDFIVTNRDYLKTQLRLCEPAVQRILLYSNNFLYKAAANAKGRIQKKVTTGSPWLQQSLDQISEEHKSFCTKTECIKKTEELKEEIGVWREKSLKSKKCARQVVEEMWISSEKILCKRFIQCVTGAGMSLIVRLCRSLSN